MSLLAIRLDGAFPGSNGSSLPPHESLAGLLHLVDEESAAQVQRFRRLEDAQRCLLGRLLPRYLLANDWHLPWSALTFERTAKGRPFATHPQIPSGFDYNVSHDSNWVVLAFVRERSSDARVGIDVMRVAVPWEGETVDDFIEGLRDQLTEHELRWLSSSLPPETKLRRIFALWTLKEAYTKAVGDGLSLDLKRLEFHFSSENALAGVVGYLDGFKLVDWSFELLELEGEHLVAVARCRSTSALAVREVELGEVLASVEPQQLPP